MQNMSWLPVAFEVVLLVGVLVVLMVAVLSGRNRSVWGPIVGFSFAMSAVMGVWQWVAVANDEGGLFFSAQNLDVVNSPMVVMDAYSAFAAILLGAVGFFGFLSSWDLQERLGKRAAEFSALMLLGVAGLHMMAATGNLLVIFIGLETASISFYVLAGFTRKARGSDESALKYFLLGSLASALFLYGVALTFAATGSLSLYGANSIRGFFADTIVTEPGILLVGMALMLVGLMFKVSAAPFHQWAPDVYQGAPSGAVGLMAAGVKVAGFAAIGRVFVAGLASQIDVWSPMLAGIAAVSMIVGTIMALVQDDLKRMLAYSGVAHAGYLLAALVAGYDGFEAMWFYLATYAFMVIGAFAVVSVVNGPGSSAAPISSFKGLASRNTHLAWLMAIIMLGMSVMPFFAGFVGKLLAFVAAGQADYIWLIVVGTLTTVIGLAFYLRVVSTMFQAPDRNDVESLVISTTSNVTILVAAGVTLVLGVFPWPLLDLVRDALPL
jgi:NADH-quinone oxidoreductase subunit N